MMATHLQHDKKDIYYFVTFTCYQWLPLIAESDLYDYFDSWVIQLKKRGVVVSGYVMMPNHIHLLVFVESKCKGLNHVLGEAKRFMAYEIVKRLKQLHKNRLLALLEKGVQANEQKIGKKHQVFKLSFDAQEIQGEENIVRTLDYIHQNPVSGKWNLVEDYVLYEYSSAAYYELEKENRNIVDYRR